MTSNFASPDKSPARKPPQWSFPSLGCSWSSYLGDWSLQRKLVLSYGLAFTVSISGIVVGKIVTDGIEREAFAIQAEATEDVENVNALKSSILELVVAEDTLLSTLEQSETLAPEQIRAEINYLLAAHASLRDRWQEFKSEDEFQVSSQAEETEGVTEEEAVIASRILSNYTETVDDYIQEIDAVFDPLDLSNLQPEDLAALSDQIRRLQQDQFIAEMPQFIADIAALAAATDEEYAEATETFQAATRTQLQLLVSSTILSGLAGLILVAAISRVLLRPLDILSTTVQQSIEEANFELRVPIVNRDETGVLSHSFNVYMDFVSKLLTEQEVANQQLKDTLEELHRTQGQIVQNEKMSSLGQLVSGIAHEINNPVNFIHGNLSHIRDYTVDLLALLEIYQRHYPNPVDEIQIATEDIDLAFIQDDLPQVLSSMKLGSDRIREIVLALRNFARLNEAEIKPVDLHEGIDNTLLILGHRLKAKPDYPAIEVTKLYGPLPQVECCAGLMNQVFMNILSNAIDALEDVQNLPRDGEKVASKITVRTSCLPDDWVEIAIADNGCGISPELQERIFDPFFTTKPVGQGTGMGMSISYQIITQRHGGRLWVESTPNEGTQFIIQLPTRYHVASA